MANKEYFSRIVQKHDIQANWDKATNFIPKLGELIVYDPDEPYDEEGNPIEGAVTYVRMKIGDGITPVTNLGYFLEDEIFDKLAEIWTELNSINEELSHKLEGEVSGQTLRLYTN